MTTEITRRHLLTTLGVVTSAALAVPREAFAQSKPLPAPQSAPTVISNPPRHFGPDAPPTTYFADPDVLTIDPAFDGLIQANTSIKRLWTGALWAEGPAWSSQGRYLLWSDIPNNRQLRWLEDDGRVTVFRSPSNNSNGNTFDAEGRQLSCEHLTRRVVRYEHDGSITIIAESFQGKRLNSPNDVAVHRDGSIWFTDPPYGGQLYEGAPCERGTEQSRRPIELESRTAGGHRHVQTRTPDERVSRRSVRPARSRRHGRSGAGPERHYLLA